MERVLDWLVSRIKARPSVALLWGAGLTIATWIVSPLWAPYVRVPESVAVVGVPCVPTKLALHAEYPATRAPVAILSAQGEASGKRVDKTWSMVVSGKEGDYIIETRTLDLKAIDESLSGVAKLKINVQVDFPGATFVDLHTLAVAYRETTGACLPIEVAGSDIREHLLSDGARVVRFRLLQEDLSNLIYKFNSLFGNLLIGLMLVVSLWLSYDVTSALRVGTNKRLRRTANELNKPKPERDASDAVASEFLRRYRTLNLWRALGPGLGFMLTVSSLVEVLHPTAQSTGDAYRFVAGIQIAVVSTFLGLLIRVLTEWDISIRERSAMATLELLEVANEQTAKH